MAESLRTRGCRLARDCRACDAALCDALPTQASTLHRLLGTLPDSPRFRLDADNPLPFDIVVVDEASMVDLPLMCKLVEAVPEGARLVLLGDPDQLPSVEAGDVLAAILAAAGDGDALQNAAVAGAPARHVRDRARNPAINPHWPAITCSCCAAIDRPRALDLAPLAEAVRNGDADAALALLRGGQLAACISTKTCSIRWPRSASALLAHWRALAEIDDPADRTGARPRACACSPRCAKARRARAASMPASRRRWRNRGWRQPWAAYFHGRLLLVTENSYRHGLFNGDIGICLRNAQGAVAGLVPRRADSGPRAFHPAALPAHESAFAMTVHKAQGSEFDRCGCSCRASRRRVLSRELVYTALTRARREVHVCASAESLRSALARRVERVSGLAARLA